MRSPNPGDPIQHDPDLPGSIRLGDLLREVGNENIQLSYSQLMPKPLADAHGRPMPRKPVTIKLRAMDVYRLLSPYLSIRFLDQFRAVAPLALYLALFQWLLLRQHVAGAVTIGAGLAAVIIGLMLFMEGLKLGLMPFSEAIGNQLPKKTGIAAILAIAFLLGVLVTFAEPAIGALQVAGSNVNPATAPYLYLLLTRWPVFLILVVGAGVGFAAILGILRFIRGWSLKPLIYTSLLPALALTLYAHFQPGLRDVIGLAWDCGGVTTGPVTVPLVLALGIGVASAVVKGNATPSGFGIVTLASIYPVMGVLGLGIWASHVFPDGAVPAAIAASAPHSGRAVGWFTATPGLEILQGLQAIIPLVMFLYLVLRFVIKDKLRNAGLIRLGLLLAAAGMIVFNLGLSYGLTRLGNQTGQLIPGAFTAIPAIDGSPFYTYSLGLGLALLFGWLLGFGATLAEPALNAMGITVENLTSGAFKKGHLMYAVSVGVGSGIALGVLKIVFGLSLAPILIPAYTAALIMTFFSREEYVNIAWDSAGVTTGPVTVPLVLAMGLGFGKAVGALEGFGMLATASVCPVITVLAFGLFLEARARWMNRKRRPQPEHKGVVV